MKQLNSILAALLMGLSVSAWAGPVDLNTADAKSLEALDGIGPTKANAIVEYRKKNGGFKSVDELTKVDGIGDKTMDILRSQVTVGGGRPAAAAPKPAK